MLKKKHAVASSAAALASDNVLKEMPMTQINAALVTLGTDVQVAEWELSQKVTETATLSKPLEIAMPDVSRHSAHMSMGKGKIAVPTIFFVDYSRLALP